MPKQLLILLTVMCTACSHAADTQGPRLSEADAKALVGRQVHATGVSDTQRLHLLSDDGASREIHAGDVAVIIGVREAGAGNWGVVVEYHRPDDAAAWTAWVSGFMLDRFYSLE